MRGPPTWPRIATGYTAVPILPWLLSACGKNTFPAGDTPPDPVEDLRVSVNGAASRSFTASGDDGATGRATAYDIRYAPDSLTGPKAGAARYKVRRRRRRRGNGYRALSAWIPLDASYFALKAADSAELVAAVQRRGGDSLPEPDKAAGGGHESGCAARARAVTLRWHLWRRRRTGRARRYEVRYATAAITGGGTMPADLPPPGGGAAESLRDPLVPNTAYFFALKTFDEAGNTALSNGVTLVRWTRGRRGHGPIPAGFSRWKP